VLPFSIPAIVSGCNSYRGIVILIAVHRRRLNGALALTWKRAPVHTAVRCVLQRLDPAGAEATVRRHAALLQAAYAAFSLTTTPEQSTCDHPSMPAYRGASAPERASQRLGAGPMAPSAPAQSVDPTRNAAGEAPWPGRYLETPRRCCQWAE
jgi:hypothetical protein